ncbi:iron-sulfur cluster repair protein YtfE (RIC family) [Sinorhizobium fredii]
MNAGSGLQHPPVRVPHEELLKLESEHLILMEVVDEIRHTTERIQHMRATDVPDLLADLDAQLRKHLLPHEKRDDEELYPKLRSHSGSPDALAGMSRTHMEIQRLVHNLTSLRRALGTNGPSPTQLYEIQRLLHGLEAITRLHFAQEQEIYRLMEAD